VLRIPNAAMRTSAARVHQPGQVFQRWQLQSQEGPLNQGSATLSIKFVQDRLLLCQGPSNAKVAKVDTFVQRAIFMLSWAVIATFHVTEKISTIPSSAKLRLSPMALVYLTSIDQQN
jgi:hypothetical protein